MEYTIKINMSPLGPAKLVGRDLVFPQVDKAPGIYRIRSGTSSYVGETTNFFRRFGGFRKPGGNENTIAPRTNRRIQRWLIEELEHGNEPLIEVCVEAQLLTEGGQSTLDLSTKDQRLLIENLLIHDERRAGRTLKNL